MLKHIKQLIIDMDGVLWRGDTPMPGLVDFFVTLRQHHIEFILATNNAAKTIEQYREKLAGLGIPIEAGRILTSAEATGSYLNERYPTGTAVYIVGEDGLHMALASRGFQILTPEQVLAGVTAPLVVVGFTRHTTYRELAMASLLVYKGATFIGSNPDVSFPHELGILPGAGALQAVITATTGVKPVIIGKPSPIMFQEALKRLGASATSTAMVGDRLNTDIAGGKEAGLHTILVLSGITKQADIANNGLKPDYIFADIRELATQLQTHE